MATDARHLPVARTGPSLRARLFGLGSIFGKTVRDGRRAAIAVGAVVAVMMGAGASALAAEWPTVELRQQLLASVELLPPVLKGLLGDPVNADTLGGFVSWRFGNILPVMLGIWSVIALSGTLANEARRGSLDLLASVPATRRRIALEKALGHIALVAVVMIVSAIVTTASAAALGTVPGDQVPLTNSLAHFTLTGLLMLAPGLVAFAVAPLLGRGRAAGLGALALFGGYLVFSYRSIAEALDVLSPLSWFVWTAGHRPLAGTWDWAPVIALAALCVVLLVAGILVFDRRDIGIPLSGGRFRLPGLPAGTSGPFARQLSDRSVAAIVAGIGIGAYGGLLAASADAFIESLGSMPGMDELVRRLYPGVDLTQPTGVLQLAFFAFGSLLVGFAAAAFVGGWASDETEDRLDLILSAPIARVRWFVSSAAGVFAAVVIAVIVAIALMALGVVGSNGDPGGLVAGAGVLVLYGAAFVGIGLAVAGLGRPDLAALVTGGLVLASYLLSLLGNVLQLPDWIVGLSLNEHLGQPLGGTFDEVGLVAMTILAIGGLALGALAFARRDVQR